MLHIHCKHKSLLGTWQQVRNPEAKMGHLFVDASAGKLGKSYKNIELTPLEDIRMSFRPVIKIVSITQYSVYHQYYNVTLARVFFFLYPTCPFSAEWMRSRIS